MSDREAWDRLGLDPDDEPTPEQLHSAYRSQAKEAHPDAGGDRAAWDSLQEAYALLAARGETLASDQPDDPGFMSRVVWAWRGWTPFRRVLVVLVVGAGLVWWIADTVMGWAGGDHQLQKSAAGLILYAVAWWGWWIWRESRRRPVKPMTWAIVPEPPFFVIKPVDSPGMVK
jgi:hypothetical protein